MKWLTRLIASLRRPSAPVHAPVKAPLVPQAPRAAMKVQPHLADQLRAAGMDVVSYGSKVLMARDVKPYDPPPGVVPSSEKQVIDARLGDIHTSFLANDDASNLPQWSWLQTNFRGLGFPGYAYLTELAQRSEYRAPSEIIASEMTRKFIKLTTRGKGDKGDKLSKLEAAMKRYDIRQVCRKAIELDLFFGRSQIFIDVKGQDTDEARALPLLFTPETIPAGSLRGFTVIEPIWTTPYTYNSLDPTQPDFYRPSAWYVLGRRIHHTRVMTVISRPVPDMLKPAYNFGGISLTQLMEPYVIRWLKTVDGVNRLINNFSVFVLKTNLESVLAGGEGTGVLHRLRTFNSTRDNQGSLCIDKDSEDLANVSASLAGLSDLQAQAQEHMAAPSHVPLVKLTGITPSGLNASSEGEITVWHEFIEAEQENILEPILDVMLDILQLNEFGAIDEEIDYEFVPLIEASLKEIADIRKSDAELGAMLIDHGVISPDEERERLMLDPNSGYNNLNGSQAPGIPEPEPSEVDGPPQDE
jgi:phage-related protein (TIGR01555 family)